MRPGYSIADAATGSAGISDIPNYLVAIRCKTCAAAGKNEWTRRRKCDAAVIVYIRSTTIVSSGRADRNSAAGGFRKQLVQLLHRLDVPPVFGGSPTNGEDGRPVLLIVDGMGNGVHPTFFVIGREIDNDASVRGKCSGNLDVQRGFRIVLGIAIGVICRGEVFNSQVGHSPRLMFEETNQIGDGGAASEGQDADTFTFTFEVGGKPVAMRNSCNRGPRSLLR